METPHGALAAPYHRNLRGNAAMFDVFLGRPDEAVARLLAPTSSMSHSVRVRPSATITPRPRRKDLPRH